LIPGLVARKALYNRLDEAGHQPLSRNSAKMGLDMGRVAHVLWGGFLLGSSFLINPQLSVLIAHRWSSNHG
jgi:hypothetical protein